MVRYFETQRRKGAKNEDEISHKIIGAAIEVHRVLGGPGLLESVYESSLCHELNLRGLQIQKQLVVPVKYKNTVVRDSLILDILVESKVIIEVKATEKEHAIHKTQLLTYLRLTGIKLGFLINFGQPSVKEGIHRVVNNL
ncbi:MAG: GxxExxY protein [Parachlamydiaceae bacterium]|nr:GxxExxY protein [Parachlamydiaceae bacterium]